MGNVIPTPAELAAISEALERYFDALRQGAQSYGSFTANSQNTIHYVEQSVGIWIPRLLAAVEALQERVNELEAWGQAYTAERNAAIDGLRAQVEALTKERDRLREFVESKFRYDSDDVSLCDLCGGEWYQHTPGCSVAAALGAAPEEPTHE